MGFSYLYPVLPVMLPPCLCPSSSQHPLCLETLLTCWPLSSLLSQLECCIFTVYTEIVPQHCLACTKPRRLSPALHELCMTMRACEPRIWKSWTLLSAAHCSIRYRNTKLPTFIGSESLKTFKKEPLGHRRGRWLWNQSVFDETDQGGG